MYKVLADLTKFGIVLFVLLAAAAGYTTSFAIEAEFSIRHFLDLMLGTYFISSGSLALNQLQEYKMDRSMPRTAKRPIASGRITPTAGGIIAFSFIFTGAYLLYQASFLSCLLGVATVVLYNGFYTYWWKPKMVFAAIPGAIPGAIPVTMGYAANTQTIFSADSVYLFAILFFWQMPHFWALAMRFKDDYRSGGVPTLPVALGVEKTLFHMGLWTFLYLILAIASPMFVHASWTYLLLVFPMSAMVLLSFFKYFKAQGEKHWLAFFMWTNLSVLVFLCVPVIDKWNFLFIKSV
jgi:protoheme IX farnesyltransferase